MREIPKSIYNNKQIQSFVKRKLIDDEVKDFFSLDELDQDEFVAICIRALGPDIEIVLDPDGVSLFTKYLMSYTTENARDVMDSLAKTAREKFSYYFNQLIEVEKELCFIDSMNEAGKRPHQDRVNGEISWY